MSATGQLPFISNRNIGWDFAVHHHVWSGYMVQTSYCSLMPRNAFPRISMENKFS